MNILQAKKETLALLEAGNAAIWSSGSGLGKTSVAGVPGEAFCEGADGKRFVRFCFAKTDSDLEEACRRIERVGALLTV